MTTSWCLGALLTESSERDPLLAWLAPACLARHARLRRDGRHPSPRQCRAAQKNAAASAHDQALLIRWSIQEIRRVAIKLAQRRIRPAYIITWSLWRRAHQAEARRAHIKRKMQL